MESRHFKDHSFKSKPKMAQEIAEILYYLLHGKFDATVDLITDLKGRSIHLEDSIQQNVLEFCEQVSFQIAYDPWHKITKEVQESADRLLEDLGYEVS